MKFDVFLLKEETSAASYTIFVSLSCFSHFKAAREEPTCSTQCEYESHNSPSLFGFSVIKSDVGGGGLNQSHTLSLKTEFNSFLVLFFTCSPTHCSW